MSEHTALRISMGSRRVDYAAGVAWKLSINVWTVIIFSPIQADNKCSDLKLNSKLPPAEEDLTLRSKVPEQLLMDASFPCTKRTDCYEKWKKANNVPQHSRLNLQKHAGCVVNTRPPATPNTTAAFVEDFDPFCILGSPLTSVGADHFTVRDKS